MYDIHQRDVYLPSKYILLQGKKATYYFMLANKKGHANHDAAVLKVL